MELIINNERVLALVQEAARLTGRSQTGAIELALRDLLRSLDAANVRHRIDLAHGIASDYSADPGKTRPPIRTADDLYDTATGLPR